MMLLPNLSVKFNQQRWCCILDPTLALSSYGIPLIEQLSEVMEIWLVREFWHILDNSQFYLQHPELLGFHSSVSSSRLNGQSPLLRDTIHSLQKWEQIRRHTSLANLKLFWIGDRLGESFLPSRIQPEIICHYESFARSLENRVDRPFDASETLISAFRDTVALAAILGFSFVLTHQLPLTENARSGIWGALNHWKIPYKTVTPQDEIAAIERNYLRQIFVQAGLSKFLWADLNLTVLHLLVPAASQLGIRLTDDCQLSDVPSPAKYPQSEANLWLGSQGFCYQL